ncbi:ABC transporter ATP-binding protein [Herbaspirillum frisingense]|uniref:dipeptide ABC transporter ATP-binding protein n=1 Tax=Herbaspirillum frisingense TaxID=92645 RepID=UPI0016009345|nr:ABC transporter ATP-binding protein [Herbaspirillum frisingense]QNB09447.1 ABC transporter ATP-binding protein [Herbaspirillum frisingense]
MLSLINITLSTKAHGKPVELLRNVSFTLQRGQVLGLVGESGAGKSMIGKLISGIPPEGFEVSRGRILFDDLDLMALNREQWRSLLGRRIAYIPQEPLTALNPVMTIGQTFDEHLMLLGIPGQERAAMILRQLESVHLPNVKDMVQRYPHQLSGGQCQRVLIAMAYAANPSLIIADEPTTALDVVSQARVLSLLREQQRMHETAVILITHDLRLAAHVCDHIAVLYAGEQIEYGPAREVLRAPRHPYTKALHEATPDVQGPQRVLAQLKGQMPGVSLLASMTGCRFAPRCPGRNDACEHGQSELRETAAGHWVRCESACEIRPMPTLQATAAESTALPWSAPRGQPEAAPIVELKNVTLRYTAKRGWFGRNKVENRAVDDFSLQIQPGEFVGIVGESGSGKSSVARLIVGTEQPSSGEIIINGINRRQAGRDVMHLVREQVQMIFQDPHSALNPRRSVMQLLTQAYEIDHHGAGAALRPRQEQARLLLQDVGLPPDCMERFPTQLSGGQKQRVNIGRALCMMPRLLVADEIVSGLDVSVQAQILNLLLELNREHGIGLLLISHDLSVVRYLCSRVLVMQAGKVVEQGRTEDVFANPQHAYTRLLLEAVPPADASVQWPPVAAAA